MNELQIKRDALADVVIGAVMEAFQKLADHRENIAQLWSEFAHLQPGETIKGCRTKTEFCERHLHRDIRTVRYMLNGGNFNRGETVSPPTLEVIEGETVSHPCLEDIEANEIYEDGNEIRAMVRLGDIRPNPYLTALKSGPLPTASTPVIEETPITLKEWRALGRPAGVAYRMPTLKVPLVLPPSTGDLNADNHIRGEFAHSMDYPYPWYSKGMAVIPVVHKNLRLAQAVNEQARLQSLGGSSLVPLPSGVATTDGRSSLLRTAAELECVIEHLMCERAEEIRREEQKRKEAEEVDLYTWFNRRHDMDGVDDYDDEREDD